MQKVFVLDVEMRGTDRGFYGLVSVLSKSSTYQTLHQTFLPAKFTAKFSSSKNKFLFVKGLRQSEDGIIRLSVCSMVRIYLKHVFSSPELTLK